MAPLNLQVPDDVCTLLLLNEFTAISFFTFVFYGVFSDVFITYKLGFIKWILVFYDQETKLSFLFADSAQGDSRWLMLSFTLRHVPE